VIRLASVDHGDRQHDDDVRELKLVLTCWLGTVFTTTTVP
jgi:hypothetical protein